MKKRDKITDDTLLSVIKYEGNNDTFIWKHPTEDFNIGSQLIVHETQEAVFFRDGKALDLFPSGRYTLETQSIPLLSKLYDEPILSDSVFHSEVYFINMITHMGIKWGTDSKIGIFDPHTGIHFQLGACGEFSIRVNDSRKLLLKLVGTKKMLTTDDLFAMSGAVGYFKGLIITKVKSYLGSIIKEQNLNLLELDSMLESLSEGLHKKIIPILDEYGMEIPQFVITRILLPEDDPNFRRMKQQFADRYLVVQEEEIRKIEAEAERERKEVEALTAARLKVIGTQGNAEALRIQKQAEADAYKMQAEAEAVEMHLKGYTYQQETSRLVGMEAMKNGIGGSEGSASAIGDIAGLGMGLGAMSGVLNMTREAMNPILNQTTDLGNSFDMTMSNNWMCSCGKKWITSNFCPDCGALQNRVWTCECGMSNLTSRFCPNCGKEKH